MKRIGSLLCAFGLLASTSSRAAAASITFNLGTQLNSASAGDNAPTSASLPSVGLLTFTDIGPQTVQLLIQSGLEASNEYFQLIVFNGSTGSDATHPRNQDLTFTLGTMSGAFSAPA